MPDDCALPVLLLLNLLTPLDTQAPVGVLPSYVTRDLDLPSALSSAAIGVLAFSLVTASAASFAALPALLRRHGVRQTLVGMLALRAAAGALYVHAVRQRAFALLVGARALYGLSLGTFAVPTIWIATHVAGESARVTAAAQANALLFVGIAIGPAWGVALFAAGGAQGVAMPGVFTVCESLLLLALVAALLSEESTEESVEGGRGAALALDGPARAARDAMTWTNFATTLVFMMGFEILLPLALRDSYGLAPQRTFGVWATLCGFLLAGFGAAPGIVAAVPWRHLLPVASVLAVATPLLSLNVSDVARPVPLRRAYLGMAYVLPIVLLNVLDTAALMRRVPARAQAGVQARLFLATQLGRALGAVVAPLWYEGFVHLVDSREAGYNGAVLFLAAGLAVARLPTWLCASEVYYGRSNLAELH